MYDNCIWYLSLAFEINRFIYGYWWIVKIPFKSLCIISHMIFYNLLQIKEIKLWIRQVKSCWRSEKHFQKQPNGLN